MEKWTSSKLEKENVKAIYCHLDYLTFWKIYKILGWMTHKLKSRLLGEILTISDMHITLMAESEEELKSLLMRVKEESEKSGLILNIKKKKKTKIRAAGSIISWQIEGEKVWGMTDFIFLGSKITVDGDCRHESRRCLLLGKKAMTNLDIMLKKQKHHFATNVHIVKATIFPVVMNRYENWAIKKAEHQRIDAFKLWSWRRKLRSPLRRSNKSILKEIKLE